ncbi:MAG: LEA type 2 family protein, partial [Acidobacteriota bacterium]|nr:LEA type 2 family protein [Acidobacteriota bacterium]
AAIRLYTRVRNPNPFGLTLRTLRGQLFLEGGRAAEADFPLGLPLSAGGDDVIPLDLRVSFADIPGLADAIRRAVSGQALGYRLDGTVGVDAGQWGTPSFGPMTLLTGDLRTR